MPMKNPARALIAYSVISKHLQPGNSGLEIEQAPMEFFRFIAAEKSGEAFSEDVFCEIARQHYGIRIPVPIIRSWAPRLEKAGILKCTDATTIGKAEFRKYVYNNVDDPGSNAQVEVESVLKSFWNYCKDDPFINKNCTREKIDDVFLDSLLHPDSLSIFTKKQQKQVGVKSASGTITLQRKIESVSLSSEEYLQELINAKLDVAVADFLVVTQQTQPDLFQKINLVAYSNLAVETLLNFAQPPNRGQTFNNAQVFFDTPLVLDMLQLHLGREQYGLEFREMVFDGKIQPCIFQHTLLELEEIIHARLNGNHAAYSRTGFINRYSEEPPRILDRLRSLEGAVEAGLNHIGIQVVDDDSMGKGASRQKIVESQAKLIEDRLVATGWAENPNARKRDVQSICDIMALRHYRKDIDKIQDVPYILVSSNTTLVNVANASWRSWLTENQTFNVSRIAPLAMNDSQLAGLIWITCGASLENISRSRLIANCANALRPSTESTKAVYSMIVDTHGTADGERFAAVMTDQRAQRMFMKQTGGEPKFLAPDMLPEFLNQLEASLISEKTKEFNEIEAKYQSENYALEQKLASEIQERNSAQAKLDHRIIADNEKLRHISEKASKRGQHWHIGISITLALIGAALAPTVAYFVKLIWNYELDLLLIFLGAVGASVGCWKIPDLLFSNFCAKRSEQYFLEHIAEYGLSYLVTDAEPVLIADPTSIAEHEEVL